MLVVLVDVSEALALVNWSKDGFEVYVNYERSPSHVLPVGELDSAVGLREDVRRGNVILAGAELLMTLDCTFKSKLTKAALAEELMSSCAVTSLKSRLKSLIHA